MERAMPALVATPARALIDVPRHVVATGFPPGQPVEITARLVQNDGSLWQSWASFIAAPDGSVDLARDAPLAGDWAGVEPMGMVWSMRARGMAGPPAATPVEDLQVAITATGAGRLRAEGQFTQQYLAPGVTRREIRTRGLVGTLFTPPGPGPHPALIMLAGSGGGIMEARAALFAAHGYTALALGYFGVPGLPPRISGTRLEYFAEALDWLRETCAPRRGFVAVAGVSRGGELSLLLGATFPERVSAVVAYVPCPFTNGVLNAGHPGQDRHDPTWTLNGAFLPALAAGNRTADWGVFDDATDAKRQTPAFMTCLGDPEAMARAMIRIERIRGPVMMVSGSDDQLWPSELFSDMAARHLAEAQFRHEVLHVRNADAGHTIGFPYTPSTVLRRPHAVSGLFMVYGGTERGNARAQETHWPQVLAFLARASGG